MKLFAGIRGTGRRRGAAASTLLASLALLGAATGWSLLGSSTNAAIDVGAAPHTAVAAFQCPFC